MLSRALSCEVKATFIWVTARHACEDTDRIAAIWRLARVLRPTVILLEDIDLFAESRENSFRSHVLGELMSQMDGAEDHNGLLTIATTNRLEVVEKALRNRPGRFDRVIHFDVPDEAGRRELLARHLAHDTPDDGVFELLVDKTEGFSGAHLTDLAKTLLEIACEKCDGNVPARAAISMDMAERALAEARGERRRTPIGFMSEPGGLRSAG
jgi:SpoVK/Ycf46/Vps4 family AAA+-type ATPase